MTAAIGRGNEGKTDEGENGDVNKPAKSILDWRKQ
jgi:hypothetical protein